MNTLIFFILLVGTLGSILLISKEQKSGIKLMLLGISIILFGGIIAIDSNSDLGGIEYLIAFAGLIISIIGFGKKD